MPTVAVASKAGSPDPASSTNEMGVGFDTTTNALTFVDSTGANRWPVAVKGGVQMAEVTIPAASVLTLRATPYTLAPAPGVGFMNVFHQITLILKYNSVAYTESVANLLVNWGTSSPVAASEIIEMTGFIDQTADTITTGMPDAGAATPLGAATKFANLPLVLFNNGAGEFANSGNSTLRVKLFYSVVPTS